MKKYKISELADILGVSYVAINKKIKKDKNNPEIIRYKNRYTVINETVKGRRTSFILLDDADLETELKEANVNKTVYKTQEKVQETYNNEGDLIDVSPLPPSVVKNELIEFTERYIKRYEDVIKEYNDKLYEKDVTILNLENEKKELEQKIKAKDLGKKDYAIILLLVTVASILLYFRLNG